MQVYARKRQCPQMSESSGFAGAGIIGSCELPFRCGSWESNLGPLQAVRALVLTLKWWVISHLYLLYLVLVCLIHKVPWLKWLNTIESYCLSVLDTQCLEERCSSSAPSEEAEETLLLRLYWRLMISGVSRLVVKLLCSLLLLTRPCFLCESVVK